VVTDFQANAKKEFSWSAFGKDLAAVSPVPPSATRIAHQGHRVHGVYPPCIVAAAAFGSSYDRASQCPGSPGMGFRFFLLGKDSSVRATQRLEVPDEVPDRWSWAGALG
jgi:hypothetical protein